MPLSQERQFKDISRPSVSFIHAW